MDIDFNEYDLYTNLQYKMFLLNLKYSSYLQILFLHLQYKMFLLNGKGFRLVRKEYEFTIQNVPIKSYHLQPT